MIRTGKRSKHDVIIVRARAHTATSEAKEPARRRKDGKGHRLVCVWSLLLKLMAVMTGVCAAQAPTAHVSVQSATQYRQAYSLLNELQGILAKLDRQKLRPVVSGSWEDQVLNGAKGAAAESLRLNLGDLSGVGFYTLPTDEGDTLVARWNGVDSGRPEQAIWLWDTPFYTTFLMEVTPTVLQASELTRYCESLFLWDRFIDLQSLKLAYLDSIAGKEQVAGLAKYKQTEQGSWSMWFAAMASTGSAYVAVGMSKPIFVDKYPSEAYQVRERFPPLRSRLANLSRQALFGELGKDYGGSRISAYPTNRDAIILGELLFRGPLSDAELQQIVIGSSDKGEYQNALIINSRVIAFLTAAERRNQLAAYAPALERVFLGAKMHPAGSFVIGHIFGTMQEHHIDFSHAALAFLERDQFPSASLFYLGQNARDEDTLQKLAAVKVKPELDLEKKLALEKIKGRLGSK